MMNLSGAIDGVSLELTLGMAWAAVYLVDARGQVKWMNAEAHRLSRTSSGAVTIENGRVCASDSAGQSRLRAAIHRSSGKEAGRGDFPVLDQSGAAFPVSVRPYAATRDTQDSERALVIVGGCKLPGEVGQCLQRAFGLTEAEIETALALADGLSIGEIAKQRSIRVHTVRTQLKNVFAKTGSRRQSELVALIWRWAMVTAKPENVASPAVAA